MSEKPLNNPLDLLQEYERLSLVHTVGLPEEEEIHGMWSGIGFRCGDERVISQLGDISEILKMPVLTRVPGSKKWLLGVANVRGNLVAIADLHWFLGGKRTQINDTTRILVIHQVGGAVGLLVDEVLGLRHFLDDEFAQGQPFEASLLSRYIDKSYLKDDELWGVFSMEKLTSNDVFLQAAA